MNLSPFGAAALGTSSFPVDRPRLAALLGFDGVMENCYDANQISPVDVRAEVNGAAATGALTVGSCSPTSRSNTPRPGPGCCCARARQTG